MSSSALIDTKPVTKNLSEFTPDKYATFHPGELVVFAIALIQDEETGVMTEEIVSVCFRLFPHSFALKNYFYWPDSALVARRLSDAREKGFIKGNPADGFTLKGKGKQIARRIAKALEVTLPTPPKVEKPKPVSVESEPAKEVSAPAAVESPEAKKTEAQLSLLPEVKETPKKKTIKRAVKVVEKKKPAKKKEPKPVTQTPKKVKPAKTKKQAKPVASAPKKIVSPAPKKKTTVKKVVTPVQVKKATVKKTVAPEKKAPAIKVVTPAPKKKTLTKNVVTPVKVKKAPVKKTVQPAPKKKAQARKPSAPKIEKKAPVVNVEKQTPVQKKETPKPKSAKPAQLTLALPTPPAKKIAEGSATKAAHGKEAKPVSKEAAPVAQVHVSKEEKDKAGKFVKLMERSDAYQQYRKNGGKAKISEFDFRNMLYATMESSAETLKRNVDLFKRYAVIHNRADLITFLSFCEDSFAPLLVPQVKRTTRK